jgi:sugar fermentation stimulation protein A
MKSGNNIMRFPAPLIEGRLIRRYKRFLADIELAQGDAAGDVITVHVPNSGAMLGLNAPGSRVWLSRSDNPKRKLAYTLELLEADGGLVGINTMHPNRIVAEAIQAGEVPELAGYARLRREVAYGRNSRVDILLEDDARPRAWVEVKNVHLRRPERGDGLAAEFPDCVTARGAKHLDELAAMAQAGDRAVLFFLAQRMDCAYVCTAEDLDPVYDAGLRRAMSMGVEVLCQACVLTPEGIEIANALPLRLRPF